MSLVVLLLAAATLAASGPARTAQAAPLPLAGRTIAIDPGHQLGNSRHLREIDRLVWVGLWKACNTTGTATNGGFPEATFTWRVSRALARRLEELGATVRMTANHEQHRRLGSVRRHPRSVRRTGRR